MIDMLDYQGITTMQHLKSPIISQTQLLTSATSATVQVIVLSLFQWVI